MQSSFNLDLACSMQAGPDDVPSIAVTPPDGQPWPLVFDHTKSDVEIAALSVKDPPPSSLAGLTHFRPNTIKFEINWEGAAAKLGSGSCFWIPAVPGVSVAFGPIEMYIAKNYPVGSCEYTATREHEDKHYKAFSAIMRAYQDYLRALWQQGNLPTQKKPAYAASFEAGTDQVNTVVERQYRDTITTMEDQLEEEADLLEQEKPAVHAKCSNW